jgi:hypothetical protein
MIEIMDSFGGLYKKEYLEELHICRQIVGYYEINEIR